MVPMSARATLMQGWQAACDEIRAEVKAMGKETSFLIVVGGRAGRCRGLVCLDSAVALPSPRCGAIGHVPICKPSALCRVPCEKFAAEIQILDIVTCVYVLGALWR